MEPLHSNCYGYVRFRKGLDADEVFTPLPKVKKLLHDFSFTSDPKNADIIAFIRGDKYDDLSKRMLHTLEHAAVIEGPDGKCSHRQSEGGEVELTTINDLLTRFICESNLVYPLLLVVSNR